MVFPKYFSTHFIPQVFPPLTRLLSWTLGALWIRQTPGRRVQRPPPSRRAGLLGAWRGPLLLLCVETRLQEGEAGEGAGMEAWTLVRGRGLSAETGQGPTGQRYQMWNVWEEEVGPSGFWLWHLSGWCCLRGWGGVGRNRAGRTPPPSDRLGFLWPGAQVEQLGRETCLGDCGSLSASGCFPLRVIFLLHRVCEHLSNPHLVSSVDIDRVERAHTSCSVSET